MPFESWFQVDAAEDPASQARTVAHFLFITLVEIDRNWYPQQDDSDNNPILAANSMDELGNTGR